jgi:hypothetical protein
VLLFWFTAPRLQLGPDSRLAIGIANAVSWGVPPALISAVSSSAHDAESGGEFPITDTSVRFMKVVVVGGIVLVVVGGMVVLLVLVVVMVVCVGCAGISAPVPSEATRLNHASVAIKITRNIAFFIEVWLCVFKGLLGRGIERLSRGQGRQLPTTTAIAPAATTWCGSLREVSAVRYLP